jgi:hypothetical protein
MHDPRVTADITLDEMVERAIRIATATVNESTQTTSLAAFSALGEFLTDGLPELDVVRLRNAALLAVEVLGNGYLIGCEAFVATLRHQLLFRFGEPNDAIRALVSEVDRRYERFVAFASDIAPSRTVVPIRRR